MFSGRGLSMAAPYGIVKNHRGEICIKTELCKGTTVRGNLPLAIELSNEIRRPRRAAHPHIYRS
jgi:signal transduction histidine kinase